MKRNRREVSKNGKGKKNYETSKKRADNVDEKKKGRERIAEIKWKRKIKRKRDQEQRDVAASKKPTT